MSIGSVWIGRLQLDNVLRANCAWSRLRGWYGYQQSPLNGVLLTQCAAIHSFAMTMSMDLLWLDDELRCIQVGLDHRPWRFAYCPQARHVLELRRSSAGSLNPALIHPEVVGEQLCWRAYQARYM